MANNIFNQEKAIGRQAARMVQDYVLRVIKQKLSTGNTPNDKMAPLLKATRVKAAMGDHRLLGLNLTSSKAGFVLHYGFTGVREATKVYLTAARYNKATTQRDSHPFNLPPKDIFKDIYLKSGAIDYLVAELSKTRTEAIQIKLDQLVLSLNKQTDGQQ